jgi:hypothetical protein
VRPPRLLAGRAPRVLDTEQHSRLRRRHGPGRSIPLFYEDGEWRLRFVFDVDKNPKKIHLDARPLHGCRLVDAADDATRARVNLALDRVKTYLEDVRDRCLDRARSSSSALNVNCPRRRVAFWINLRRASPSCARRSPIAAQCAPRVSSSGSLARSADVPR